MKKNAKKIIAIISVIVLLGVIVLTLGLVRIRQDKYFFDGYSSFEIYNLESSTQFPDITNEVKSSLKSTSFSLLGAMLEGRFSYAPTIVKDDEGDPIYLSDTNIAGMSATSDRYLLHFSYDSVKSIKVDGEKYQYNRAYVFIQEGDGEIVDVRVIPYVLENIHNGDGDNSTEFYNIPDLRIKMRTSKLYVTIENAIGDFSA